MRRGEICFRAESHRPDRVVEVVMENRDTGGRVGIILQWESNGSALE